MIARAANVGQRLETCDERADRLWLELMHEVRVVLTAVQLLVTFLLAVAFTPAYERLADTDCLLYLLCLLCGAAVMAALTAPVVLHRLVTGLRQKSETVAWASRLVAAGLILLLTMTSLGLLVVLRQVAGPTTGILLGTLMFLWCALCWGVPAYALRRRGRVRPAPRPAPEEAGPAAPAPGRNPGPHGARFRTGEESSSASDLCCGSTDDGGLGRGPASAGTARPDTGPRTRPRLLHGHQRSAPSARPARPGPSARKGPWISPA
ncbi:DUF6328 family protein [Streptomyces sp. NPDC008265]|uniref:DUF6328 family protein n=1 Tax=Streptomyces sp. NPDC008265 TaxID=3364824 RepID=UPI0036E28002